MSITNKLKHENNKSQRYDGYKNTPNANLYHTTAA